MRAPLSVIIPTLDAAEGLPGTLASLMSGLQAGLIRELLISDGGSTDATIRIAEEVGARLLTGRPGRGAQLARGAERAGGDWLLFLHADTELSPGWTDAVEAHIARTPDHAAHFRLAFRDGGTPGRIVAGWANLRARVLGLPFGDQGLLISRKTLDSIGGVPDLPLMEDVALARALKGRLRPLEAEARTSPARYQSEGWITRGTRNLALQVRFFLGADPAKLARRYASRPEN
ncbi:TIGR04283 family arsenosugar biosynthesis glycosyltransferase [Ovoidimarina sediminis]|uniref:TIGR04283 family arsenosugar biosynthesis glycosyltransferase n=1 Tax=Ovoidimarina sediminis TaxID=3079856 RepID=UPI0029128A7D|nr:TIGR04283 family arsenosugar biosynthesis glycosyltransferase [Rhodophyticola sp. MJ-SS7]MDU8944935.1 TIGR04283 family arsenosugar biosynthesis glycosyltransferase [Rhodophyticola sp. MJ-SS7]